MIPQPKREPERLVLNSWKEIAAALGVTVRSAQRWEQAGLPVYRQGSGKKARVFSYTDELLAWREQVALRAEVREAAAEEAPAVEPRRPGSIRVTLVAVPALAVAALALYLVTGITPAEPASWSLNSGLFTVRSASSAIVWEKRFQNLDSSYYTYPPTDKALIADLDGDGHQEVLLNYVPNRLRPEASFTVTTGQANCAGKSPMAGAYSGETAPLPAPTEVGICGLPTTTS